MHFLKAGHGQATSCKKTCIRVFTVEMDILFELSIFCEAPKFCNFQKPHIDKQQAEKRQCRRVACDQVYTFEAGGHCKCQQNINYNLFPIANIITFNLQGLHLFIPLLPDIRHDIHLNILTKS